MVFPQPQAHSFLPALAVSARRGGCKLARTLWHLFKFRQAFNTEVFRNGEEKIQRKKLARLHNSAAALGLKLVPVQ